MADQPIYIHKQERLEKQLKATMSSLGELDKRINDLEALVLATMTKVQSDQVQLFSLFSSINESRSAAEKFNMDATLSTPPNAPPEEVSAAG